MKRFLIAAVLLGIMTCIGRAAGAENAASYQAHLANLFTDFSCTELKPGINATNLPDNDDYKSLPSALQTMAMKIVKGDWSEINSYNNVNADWADSYARKYRVQLYEPYSEGGAAASMAGISQYTNMCNPTGILGDKGSTLYVMVRDDIKDGSSLYIREIPDVNYHNDVKDAPENIDGVTIRGIKLNKGLNIITTQFDNSHLFIYYSVATAAIPSGGSRYQHVEKNKLSNFSPIKIHIEGGRINGFFNYVGDTVADTNGETLYKGDTEDDFKYTVARATHPMYDLIGRYLILHFHLEDTPNGSSAPIKGVKSALLTNRTPGADREYNPETILKSWDRMCMSERILMGLQSDEEINEFNSMYAGPLLGNPDGSYYETIVNTNDKVTAGGTTYSLDPGYHYNDYFNNKLMGISQNREGLFMSATSWRMAFHVNTVEAILTLFDHGDIWGPAHEYGHINQGPINMAGTTEESNNIFSNVAVYFVGKQTSRSDFISNQFKIFQQGKNFLEHGTWGTTRMFWQLWCYYHATGHNKKFFPRLYELLRNHPIKKVTRPGKHNEYYDQLQFAKMCCIAAGEDLTDFFTAWGFFIPLEYMFINDYSQYDAYLTREDIDAAKAEIAGFRFPKNESIILIDDRPGITDRDSYDGFPIRNAGEFGGLDAFRNETTPQGNFSFTISLNRVTIETDGTPGAGYIIRDKDGNLLGFSNSSSFEVSDELAEKLLSGEAYVTAVGADNAHTTANVVNTALDGSDEQKKALLNDILTATADLLKYVDTTGSKVGYIKEEAASALRQWYDKAIDQSKLETPETPLTELIEGLSTAYNKLLDDDSNFIGIELGNTYVLYNNGRGTQYSLTTDGKVCTATKTGTQTSVPESQQWFLQPQPDGSYYMKNYSSNVYVSSGGVQSASFNVSSTDRIALAINSVRVKGSNIGLFSIAPPGSSMGMHLTNYATIIGWTTSAGASQWSIVKVHDATDDALSGKLIDEYRGLLEGIIKRYESLEDNIDPTGVKVGYLKPGAKEVIEVICDKIQAFIDDNNLSVADYQSIYEEQFALYNDYSTFGSDLYIDIESGAAYTITSVYNPSRVLAATSATIVASEPAKVAFSGRWVFKKADEYGMYLIRNFEEKGFIPSVGISYDSGIALRDKGDPYALVPVNENIGHFGISADGYNMNSLVINSSGTAVSLSAMTNEYGRWMITKIHDKEFVSLRDALSEALDVAQDLIFNHWQEFPDMETYMDLWNSVEDARGVYNDINCSIDKLKETVENLSNLNAQCDALINNSEIVTASVLQGFNDATDNSTGAVNRTAFSPSGTYTITNFLKLSKDVDPASIQVSVAPADDWISANADTDLSSAYKNAFAAMGADPKVSEQFDI
ncbi:MAG: M60 family metallopeptidase, partial [Duncaniella sp.]|nr:M60 family metallopeptidase [Duncaniella sp.]